MGDVALTAPVIHSVLESNPNVEITFLSRGFFEPLFNKSKQFKFVSADLQNEHKGVLGLRKLYKELKAEKFDAVVDLHDVLRTKIIRTFFKFDGTPVYKIDKGRKEKEDIVLKRKPLRELKHTQQRYLDVFQEAGISASLQTKAFLKVENDAVIIQFLAPFSEKTIIGIAPFAAHWTKEIEGGRLLDVIKHLTIQKEFIVLLFGGGKNEEKVLRGIAQQHENCFNVAGKFSFQQELILMNQLAVMIAMDSGNMHLASLVNTKVVSIWTATHPYLGFSPYQNKDYYVQVPVSELPCRPCTVYGKVRAKVQDDCALESIQKITTEMIVEKVDLALKTSEN